MDLSDIKKPKLYNMHETAAFMKVSYHTLYRMVKNGKIKAMNIAKSGTKPIFAFKAEDVQEYYSSIGASNSDPYPSVSDRK